MNKFIVIKAIGMNASNDCVTHIRVDIITQVTTASRAMKEQRPNVNTMIYCDSMVNGVVATDMEINEVMKLMTEASL